MKAFKTSTSERKSSFEWPRPDPGLRLLWMTTLLLSLISTAEGQSFVSFGGTPTNATTGPSTTHQAFQDNGWFLSNVKDFSFGGKSYYSSSSVFQLEPSYQQIMLTTDAWNAMAQILESKGFTIGDLAYYYGPCTDFSNSEMPVLNFTIDNMIYSLPWSAYSEYGTWTNGTNICIAGVSFNPQPNAATTTILGNFFINNFVSEIDFSNATSTFMQNAFFESANATVTQAPQVLFAAAYLGYDQGFVLYPYVGTPMQKLEGAIYPISEIDNGMAISLGTSPYFAITTTNCYTCEAVFNPYISSTFYETFSQKYWASECFNGNFWRNVSFSGNPGTETLCIPTAQGDACIPNFNMTFITYESSYYTIPTNGIFLLEPVVQGFYNQGTISSQIASLVFTPNSSPSQSFVSFGGTPTNATTGPSTTHQAFQENGWFLSNVTGFTFNGNNYYSSSSVFQLEPTYPQIMLAADAWPDMNRILEYEKGFYYSQSSMQRYDVSCSDFSNSEMPVLSFVIDNMIYSLPWSAYSQTAINSQGVSYCIAGVFYNPQSNAATTTILGVAFINNFVTEIDFVQSTLTFTQNAYQSGAIVTPVPPTPVPVPEFEAAATYRGVAGGFAVNPYVGAPMQQIYLNETYTIAGMAISLGTSPYFAITTSYCGNCIETFNPANSATFDPLAGVSSVTWDIWGFGNQTAQSLTGILGYETLCIPTGGIYECISDLEMVFITSENKGSGYLDYLGNFLLEPVVQGLYNQGTIPSKTASLVFTPNSSPSQSFVSFGGTPTNATTGPSTIHQAFQENGWFLSNGQDFAFGGNSYYNSSSLFQLEPTYPQIMLTTDAWNAMAQILQSKGFLISGDLAQYSGPCTDFSNSEMPVLSFTIDNMLYSLPWSAYSEYGTWTNGINLCIAGVSLNPQPNANTTTILGDAFINNFVTEINFANSTLTFTQNAFYVSANATVTGIPFATASYLGVGQGFASYPSVGTPIQQINGSSFGMAISLGTSPYFAMTTTNCGSCYATFDPANSSTYQVDSSSVQWFTECIGEYSWYNESFTGNPGTETLCFPSATGDVSIPNFNMVFITSENEPTSFLGTLGMFLIEPVVQGFYNLGTISSQIASLVFTPNFNTTQSFVSFCGSPTNATTGPSSTHQAIQDNGWFLSNVTAFTFNGNSYYNSSSVFQLEPTYPQIMLATGAWIDMINILKPKGFAITGDLAQYSGPCTDFSNSEMPVLSFTIDNTIYSLPWSAYSEYGAWTNGTNLCTAGVSVNPQSNAATTTILGAAFINNFVTEIDFVQSTLTFTQNAYFVSGGAIVTQAPPTPVPGPELDANVVYSSASNGFGINPYVGAPMQLIYLSDAPSAGMVISLGTSPYFAITTSYCGNCQESFNPANSATYNAQVDGSSVSWDFWGFGNLTAQSLTGIQGQETLCIPIGGIYECISDFEMVFITSENNGSGYLDLLGIFLLEPVVQGFYNQGTIPSQTASLVFTPNPYTPYYSESFVSFGGTPTFATTGPSTTHQAFQDNGWFLSNVTAFTFNGNSYYDSSSLFQLEPSYQQIMLATEAWNAMALILQSKGFVISGDLAQLYGPCTQFSNSEMPVLSFTIDNMIYSLPWSAYSEQTLKNFSYLCTAGVSVNPQSNAATTTILGTNFISNFVTEIDFANSTLTFTQNAYFVGGGAIVTQAPPTPVPVPEVVATAVYQGAGNGFGLIPFIGLPMQLMAVYEQQLQDSPTHGMAISLGTSPYFAISTKKFCNYQSCNSVYNPEYSATYDPVVDVSAVSWDFWNFWENDNGWLFNNSTLSLTGIQGDETLCIQTGVKYECISDFEMVFIASQNNFYNPDWLGIFLLEPVVQGFYNQGTISSKTASLVFTPNSSPSQSFVSFGGTPTNATTGPSTTHQAFQDNGWFLSNVSSFQFGGNSYQNSSSAFQLDPSFPMIMLTTDAWSAMEEILKTLGFEMYEEYGNLFYYQGPCTDFSNSEMPVLRFTIDNMIYSLPWSAYSEQIGKDGYYSCIPGVSFNPESNAATTTILGTNFISNFVTEIDFVQSTLTFTQNAFFVSAGAMVTPAPPTPVPVPEFEAAATYRNTTSGFAFNPYVGLPMQQISLYDSPIQGMAISLGTSPYFAITTSNCNNCLESFNPANSTTYNAQVDGSQVSWDFWGFGTQTAQSLTGTQGSETLCIPTGGTYYCLTDFEMVFITSENKGSDYLDWLGIFLLEPVVQGFYKQGTISSQTASLVFTPNKNTTQSFISFGGTPANATTGPSTTHSATQNNGWFLSHVTGFKFDGKSYHNSLSAFQLDPSYGQIMLTTDAWSAMAQILQKNGFEVAGNVASYSGPCTDFSNSKMPVLSFTIDKMMYDLPWSAYSQYDSNLCIAGVSLNPQSNAATTTILGDAFINNFVTEIDFANSTLTFTQNAYFASGKATVANKLSTAGLVGSIVGGIVLLAAIAAICFFCIRRAKQRKAAIQSPHAVNVANKEIAHSSLQTPAYSTQEQTEDNGEIEEPILAGQGRDKTGGLSSINNNF